jgi:hypothetical protein
MRSCATAGCGVTKSSRRRLRNGQSINPRLIPAIYGVRRFALSS